MKDRLAKAEALFHEALELPPAQREGFLQQACGQDAALRDEVAALLRASGVADHWLTDADCGAGDPSVGSSAPHTISEGPGMVIGRYKLLEKIGEGGFGVVYMAEQDEPVRRKVALKIIKLGMDTRSVIARFEAERQTLALMAHPHIAKVFDAGATETGRPYFVMELVRGVPITRFCNESQLNTRERLELFIQVCGAIQHAHQKGIIHRDIKPTNVLVTLNDGVAHPMVIDFGVAKAINQRLTEKTLFTNFAQMIGTPAYMSPEQAEMSKLDVDTRSDVYSLGVLLYELLTGAPPFPEERLRSAGYAEMQRIISEEEPLRPSTRFSTMSNEDRASIAQQRKVDPARLGLLIRGDLDWMVMKSLEKDRTRRYDTASALALDIQRHLNNEPILARPPSNLYRFQKLVRRNKLAFAAAGAVAAALIAGLGLSTWLYFRERAALKAASQNALRAEQKAQESRRNLYAADMFLAQGALEAGNIGRARELLRKYLPRKGEKDLRGWEWRYAWDQCRTDELFTLQGHTLPVSTLALSTNGTMLVSGSHDESVVIWDLKNKTPIRTLTQTGGVRDLAFSKDEQELVVGTADGQVTVWNCQNWQPVATLTNLSRVRSLRVSPDGKILAVFGLRVLTLWNLADRHELARIRLRGSNELIHGGVAFSPDSSLLAYSRGDGVIVLRDLAKGETITELQAHERYVSALAFSPDGSVLVSGSRDRTVRVWDVASQKQLRQIGDSSGFVTWVAFSPEGALLAVVGAAQRIRLFETRSWEEINSFKGHSDVVTSVVFSPDGKTMFTGSRDSTIKGWTASTNQQPVSQPLPSDVYSAALLPGAKSLYLAHTNQTYSFWRTDPFQEIARYPFPLPHFTTSMISPDGKLWVAATTNDVVKVFDHVKQRFFTDLPLPATPPLPATAILRARFAFSVDGQMLAALGNDYTCRVWRVVSLAAPKSDERAPAASKLPSEDGFQEVAVFGTRKQPVWSRVILSPSGRLLALGYNGGVTEIWNVTTCQKVAELHGDPWAVMDIAFSRDDSTVVTASGSGKAKIWDLKSQREIATLPGELSSLQSVAYSPDETRIAGCGGEGTIRIWDVETRQEVAALKVHNERLDRLAFSSDESLVVLAADAFGQSRLFVLRAPNN